MLKSMSSATGRMAVVLPHGVLFRMGVEAKIRRAILEADKLEAIIGLGPNLFYGTGLAACIMIFRARKKPDRRNRVLIIDASEQYKRGRNQNTLLPEHVDHILKWYAGFKNGKGVARVVTLDEIAKNDWNLNIPRYVERVNNEKTITLDEAIGNLKTTLADAYAAEDRLKGLLRKEGLLK
jgi:type I restriction enzyme M protein